MCEREESAHREEVNALALLCRLNKKTEFLHLSMENVLQKLIVLYQVIQNLLRRAFCMDKTKIFCNYEGVDSVCILKCLIVIVHFSQRLLATPLRKYLFPKKKDRKRKK